MYSEMSDPREAPWRFTVGEGPLIAVAVHNGHAIRQDIAEFLALSPRDRLREEDPYTGRWTTIAPSRFVVERSRFEVDLNRPREKAVYLDPVDAWGLSVWKEPLPDAIVQESLRLYDAFYDRLEGMLSTLLIRHERVVVFDLHSYNHRRGGSDGPLADPAANPEINVGTGTMPRDVWAPVVDRFMDDLRSWRFRGRQLDVRENVRFQGGELPRWVHTTFPGRACALAVEVKKFFMDEWTGAADEPMIEELGRALGSTVPGILEALGAGVHAHRTLG